MAEKKAPAKKKPAAKKELELRDDGYWWYGNKNLGRSQRYAEKLVAEGNA